MVLFMPENTVHPEKIRSRTQFVSKKKKFIAKEYHVLVEEVVNNGRSKELARSGSRSLKVKIFSFGLCR